MISRVAMAIWNILKKLGKSWTEAQQVRAEWEVLEYRRRVERQRDGLSW